MTDTYTAVQRQSLWGWGVLTILTITLAIIFYTPLSLLVHSWSNSEEYGYGFLIPIITAFLIWQKKDQLEKLPFTGSWTGIVVLLSGLALFFLGEISTIYTLSQYALVITVCGLAWAIMGGQAFKIVAVPMLFLFFMVPLPSFLNKALSFQLQLMSSELGVAVIRLSNISVNLEGNVIDLGQYKLQVVEACSGLRYLFPLAALSFLVAYFFRAAFWKRAVVFLSSIPITLLMNSARIGMIGIMVEYWGSGMAEGFMHYFEGWVIFMACLVLLIGEVWLFTRIGGTGVKMGDVFSIDLPPPSRRGLAATTRPLTPTLWVASALIVAATVTVPLLGQRQEIIPAREPFTNFPDSIGSWTGHRDRIENMYLDVLKMDDYVLTNFTSGSNDVANLYIAYYATQRSGEAAHSPRSCIPGGGWKIKSLEQHARQDVLMNGAPLKLNRLLIQKGDERQLVYYWFQQRGRNITNEYLVKWFIFWDALAKNRTDGALVRLTTPIRPAENEADGDRRLIDLANKAVPLLKSYVPE